MKRQVTQSGVQWLRLVGLGLLGLLLWRLDVATLGQIVHDADWQFVLVAVALGPLLVLVKSVRWQTLMFSQGIRYRVDKAYLSYFGSIFIGLLTPGRLGEFVKALHISQDCNLSMGRALSSVLADRLFDLYALLVVGGTALLGLGQGSGQSKLAGLALFVLGLTVPLAVFLHDGAFNLAQGIGLRQWRLDQYLSAPESWILQLRSGLLQLSLPWVVVAVILTILGYAIFFGQCYLLALALGLHVSFIQVSYAVALGSLVTLVPISISGLGTREAAIVAYLVTTGVAAEAAFAFSLLVFVTFYVAGVVMGAVAWCVKPVPLKRLR